MDSCNGMKLVLPVDFPFEGKAGNPGTELANKHLMLNRPASALYMLLLSMYVVMFLVEHIFSING